jgi:hypothetical protein
MAPERLYIPQTAPHETEMFFPEFSSPVASLYWPQSTVEANQLPHVTSHQYPVAGVPWLSENPSRAQVSDIDTTASGYVNTGHAPSHGQRQAHEQAQGFERPESELNGIPDPVNDISSEGDAWSLDASTASRSRSSRMDSGHLSRNPEVHIPMNTGTIGLHDTASHSSNDFVDHSFLRQSFPLDSEEHRKFRDALQIVMQSTWKRNNEFEPDGASLLQFMAHDDNEGRWHCLFWKEGRPCECSCKKKYHAKGHIRSHIDLLPFVCNERWCVELGKRSIQSDVFLESDQ